MEAVNINHIGGESNYRLLDEPIRLKSRIVHVPTLDELRWEDDGGTVVDSVREETVEEYFKQKMRVHGPKKQRAARMYRPFESIKVVKISKPAPAEVVGVRLGGGTKEDEKIAELEAKIKALLGLVRGRQAAERKLDESIVKLQEVFDSKRTK